MRVYYYNEILKTNCKKIFETKEEMMVFFEKYKMLKIISIEN